MLDKHQQTVALIVAVLRYNKVMHSHNRSYTLYKQLMTISNGRIDLNSWQLP